MAAITTESAPRPPDAQAALEHIDLAQRLLSLDQLDEAAGLYWRAVECAPNHAPAHFGLAAVLRRLGHPIEALACLRRAVMLAPEDGHIQAAFADILRRLGETTEARIAFENVVRLRPDDGEALLGLVETLIDAGEPDRALALCSRAAALSLSAPDTERLKRILDTNRELIGRQLLAAADAAHALRDWPAAIQAWEAVLGHMPGHAPATVKLIHALRISGRIDDAESLSQKSLALASDYPEILAEHARNANVRHDWPEALTERLKRILDTNRELIGRQLLAAADAAHALRDWPAAIQAWEAVLGHMPGHAPATVKLIHALRISGRIDDAESLSQKSLALASDYPEILAEHARNANVRHDWPEALLRWEAANAVLPDQPYSQLGWAEALREAGRIAEAGRIYRDALARDPSNPAFLKGHALCAGSLEDWSTATQAWEALLRIYPDYPNVIAGHAAALRESGNIAVAESNCRSALERHPDSLALLECHASCASSRQDWHKAVTRWGEVVRRYPDNQQGATMLEAARQRIDQGSRVEPEPGFASGPKQPVPLTAQTAVLPSGTEELIASHLAEARNARDRGDRQTSLAHVEAVLEIDPTHLAARVQAASDLTGLRRTDDADAMYQQILAEHPAHVPALVGRGYLDLRLGDTQAALARFGAVLEIDPAHLTARMETANALSALGRTGEAEGLLHQFLQERPDHVPALFSLGQIERNRGDLRTSLARFKAVLAIDPTHLAARVETAGLLTALGREDESERVLQQVLGERPTHIPALMGLGYVEYRRGDHQAVLARFEAVLEVNPTHLGARTEAARALTELGREEEAEKLLHQILQEHPDHVPARIGLGQIERQRGDRLASLAQFEALLAVDPSHLRGRLERARLLAELGETEEAERVISEILEHHSEHGPAWAARGRLERQAGRHEAALAAFQEYASRIPDTAHPWVEIAHELRMLRRPDASLAALTQALDREADYLPALLALVQHERMAERYEAALAAAERTVAAHPLSLSAQLALCRAAANLGLIELASQRLDEAAEKFGDEPDIDLLRAQLALDAGQFDRAWEIATTTSPRKRRHFGWRAQAVRMATRIGKLDEAAAALEDLRAQSISERVEFHLLSAGIEKELWRLQSARDEVRMALALDPENPAAHEAMAMLALMLFDLKEARTHLSLVNSKRTSARLLQGRSLNVSQSFLGQLLVELETSRELEGDLRSLVESSSPEGVEELRQIVRRNERATAPAICLLIALRQTEMLRSLDFGGDAVTPRIPHRVIQYWNDKNIPPQISEMMSSWSDINSGYDYIKFDSTDAASFISSHYSSAVLTAFQRVHDPAQKADLFRLAYLFSEGGFYADADDRCLAPLPDAFFDLASFVGYQEEHGTIGNNFLGAVPRHPVIGRALVASVGSINRGDRDMLWLATGPGVISRSFALDLTLSSMPPRDYLKQQIILTRAQLARYVACHCRANYKLERHWSQTSVAPKQGIRSPTIP